jgi:hypothetical protein
MLREQSDIKISQQKIVLMASLSVPRWKRSRAAKLLVRKMSGSTQNEQHCPAFFLLLCPPFSSFALISPSQPESSTSKSGEKFFSLSTDGKVFFLIQNNKTESLPLVSSPSLFVVVVVVPSIQMI